MSFFLESLLLALIGGLIGCASGSLCHGRTMHSIVSSGQGGGKTVVFQMVVNPLILAVGLGVFPADGGGRRLHPSPVGDAAQATGIAALN